MRLASSQLDRLLVHVPREAIDSWSARSGGVRVGSGEIAYSVRRVPHGTAAPAPAATPAATPSRDTGSDSRGV